VRSALDAGVERRLDPGVADAEAVRLAGLEGEGRRGLQVLAALAVDEHARGAAYALAGVDLAGQHLVVLGVPVSDEHHVVVLRRRLVERDRDEEAADHADGPVAACLARPRIRDYLRLLPRHQRPPRRPRPAPPFHVPPLSRLHHARSTVLLRPLAVAVAPPKPHDVVLLGA
jgi:hypothetical protein